MYETKVIYATQPQEVIGYLLASSRLEQAASTRNPKNVHQKSKRKNKGTVDPSQLCACSRHVLDGRYRVRFDERLHNRYLSVKQLGSTDRWRAVLHSDWLEAMAQRRAQQFDVVSRFPLQMTQKCRSHRLIFVDDDDDDMSILSRCRHCYNYLKTNFAKPGTDANFD